MGLTITSYVIPAVWTLLAVIVEFSGPLCAPYRPKFGFPKYGLMNECFFTGNVRFHCLHLIVLSFDFLLVKVLKA